MALTVRRGVQEGGAGTAAEGGDVILLTAGFFPAAIRNYLQLYRWPGEILTFTDLPLIKGCPQHASDVLPWCILSYFKPTMWGQIIADECRM